MMFDNTRSDRRSDSPSYLDEKPSLWLCEAILYVASLFMTGCYVYRGNHAIQLPLVHLLNDASLYPNDPFASTLPYYASMLWRTVALGNRFIPVKPLLIALFLLERLLVIHSSGRLARAINPNSRLTVIAAMAMFALAPSPILGGGTIVTNYFEQTGLSIPFFLLAIAAFYTNRRMSWAVWLALAFNLNAMYGAYAITYFAASLILDHHYRQAWKEWVLPIALFVLMASPSIFLAAQAYGTSAVNDDIWILASQARVPHHLYPLTWGTVPFVKFGMLMYLVVALSYKARMARLFTHGIIWAGVSVSWLLYAFVAAYWAKSQYMLVMQPARGTDLWYCFAGVALLSIFARKAEENTKGYGLAAICVLATLFFWRSYPIAVVLTLITTIALMRKSVWGYRLRVGGSNRLALIPVVLTLCLGANSLRWRLNSGAVAGFIVPPNPHIEEVADWAESATPVAAVFLVNPTWMQFRALSKRPVFVTWKDGSAILWHRSYVDEWVRRLTALGLDITGAGGRGPNPNVRTRISHLYAHMNDQDIETLKESFPIKFWVVPRGHVSVYPTAFQTQHYRVLDVRGS